MDNPEEVVTELQNRLRQWSILGRKAQLEAAMPLLDSLVQSKVEYKILANVLQQGGLDIKTDNLRRAISRWRKRQAHREAVFGIVKVREQAMPVTSADTEDANSGMSRASRHSVASDATMQEPSHEASARRVVERNLQNVKVPPPGQLTKARLKEIRDEHIDLEALAKAASHTLKQ